MLTKYQPSGKFSSGFLPLLPVMALAAAGLGAVYQVIVHYLPFVMLNALACLFFAFALGWVVGKGLQLSKCRRGSVATLVALPMASLALAASYYVSYWLTIPSSGPTPGFLEFIEWRVATGWKVGKSSSGIPITGWGVWVIWAIEAIGVLFISSTAALGAVYKPFCETCQQWATRKLGHFSIPIVNDATVDSVRNATDVATLTLPESDPAIAASPHPTTSLAKGAEPVPVGTTRSALKYTVAACPVCDQSNYLTISHEVVKQAAKKKVEASSKELHEHIVLTADEAGAILAMASELSTPPSQPTASV